MTLDTPAWLRQHNGGLKLASDRTTWLVLLNGEPQYSLTAVPVHGKHGAVIKQTINGRQLPSSGVYASAEQALGGGLEDLRQALGW